MNSSSPHLPLADSNSRSGSCFSLESKILRFFWLFVYIVVFRPSPRFCHAWRRFILRLFGATITGPARIYPKAKIWIPSNLLIHGRSSIADDVYIYNIATVTLGNNVVVSQGSVLCTGTHDYNSKNFSLLAYPIAVEDEAWIAFNCFVHPGVVVGQGAVVGACSVVVKSLPPWSVCAGNPAIRIKNRHPIIS